MKAIKCVVIMVVIAVGIAGLGIVAGLGGHKEVTVVEGSSMDGTSSNVDSGTDKVVSEVKAVSKVDGRTDK